MSDDPFGHLVAAVDTALIVVTAAAGGERAGCLVGFHSQSSIGPERYTVWLSKANHTYRVALRATHLGVHFLTDHDLAVAERFGSLSGDDVDKFDGLGVEVGPGDVPVLVALPHRMIVHRTALLDEGGDHVCIATEVVSAHTAGPFEPLRLSRATGIEPGHSSTERNSPPTERAGGAQRSVVPGPRSLGDTGSRF